jgi:outer membrane protein
MKKILTSALVLVASLAFAQAATKMTLDSAVQQAFKNGPDVASSFATLENARADLKSKQADPSTLILQLTQAQNTVELNTVQVQAKRIEVVGNVTNAFISLYEAQENIAVLEANVNLDQRNLDVAKAKLAQKNGTQLDVSKAQNTLAGDKQSLSDAKANLPILSNKLEPLMGLSLNANLVAADPPVFKEVKIDLAALQDGLEKRVASVLQASQSVEIADLNVKLADNDYTAPATLRDNKTTLENAKRSLETSRSSAATSLKDAYRSLLNSLERVKVAATDLDNQKESLSQDQVKFKNGTISRLTLEQTQVATLKSQYSYLQASDNYLKALNQVSSTAGSDVTGLVTKGMGDPK